MSGRLMSRASYAPTLSDEEAAILGALTDDQKLAVAHSIRVMVQERTGAHKARYAALCAALSELEEAMRAVEDDAYSTTAATVHLWADRLAAIRQAHQP